MVSRRLPEPKGASGHSDLGSAKDAMAKTLTGRGERGGPRPERPPVAFLGPRFHLTKTLGEGLDSPGLLAAAAAAAASMCHLWTHSGAVSYL